MALIPRDEEFLELFLDQAKCVQEAARLLTDLMDKFDDVEKRVKEIEFIEHRGDQLTHTLMQRLNKTFITPFDREDMHALGSGLDEDRKSTRLNSSH